MLSTRIAARWIYLNRTSNPHKLILVHLEHRSKLAQALSERICHELREVHLNAQQTDKIIESPHVPYTVVITERTLFDGVTRLQHYKPRIDEEVHVGDLRDRILQQMGSVTFRGPTTGLANIGPTKIDPANVHRPADDGDKA